MSDRKIALLLKVLFLGIYTPLSPALEHMSAFCFIFKILYFRAQRISNEAEFEVILFSIFCILYKKRMIRLPKSTFG